MTSTKQKEDIVRCRRRRVGRLKTAGDVSHFIALCVKRAARGEGENLNFKLVNMATQLLKAIEIAEIERRIEQLQKRL
jgi:hypothetical protein